MLNFRQTDNKFGLSGGWVNLNEDIKWLTIFKFKAVLDLQFSKFDYNRASILSIKEVCDETGIEYQALPLDDGYNDDIGTRFEVAYATLLDWDTKFIGKTDRILVKSGAGISRSVATLAYFYCRRDLLSYKKVRTQIQSRDYSGQPIGVDSFFEKWLLERFP